MTDKAVKPKTRKKQGKPRLSPLEEYKQCLERDDFEGARRVVDTRLNGQKTSLLAKALYCASADDKIRTLCAHKRYEDAKRFAFLFLDFGFDVYWRDYGK